MSQRMIVNMERVKMRVKMIVYPTPIPGTDATPIMLRIMAKMIHPARSSIIADEMIIMPISLR